MSRKLSRRERREAQRTAQREAAEPSRASASVDPAGSEPGSDRSRLQSATDPPGSADPRDEKNPHLADIARIQRDISSLCSQMPSPRWVKFARGLANGETQAQAAIDAGFAPAGARQQGNRLAGEPLIEQLVEALQMLAIVTEAAIDKPALRKALLEVISMGSDKDKVAAVRAAMKLEGYDRTRIEVTGSVGTVDPEELRRQLAERLARQRAAGDSGA